MSRSKRSDDQTEAHIYRNHGNVLSVEAAKFYSKLGPQIRNGGMFYTLEEN